MKAISRPLPEMVKYFENENSYLKNLVNAEGIILDVGCGNGRTIKFLAPHVKKAVGIDYDSKMIKAAEKHLRGISNTELIHENFFKAEFSTNFDLVFASYNLLGSPEVLPEERRSFLIKMARLTKPGGHVVISVWSDAGISFATKYYQNIGIEVVEIKKYNVITDRGVFKRFTKKDLKELAKNIGYSFKIITLTPIFYLLDIKI